ncbi:MAG: DUF2179 domain-containing protein [Balneolaceae bacterium]|nr:DUF2179 domain-containing protein [Balneolaceae bacterium]
MEIISSAYIPIFIFLARIVDVSIGTIRIMFVSKGYRGKASLLGFFEVLIWILIVAQIFQNLDNWLNYVAYAGGFAAGNYVGMFIEEKMKMGIQIFRIVVGNDSVFLTNQLRKADFRVISVDGEGAKGPVKILFTIAKRKRWPELAELIHQHDPSAFYSAEDVRSVSLMEEDVKHLAGQDIVSRMLKLKKGI